MKKDSTVPLAFFSSGATVILRGVIGLAAFVTIARQATGSELAVYAIASFFWGISYASGQSFAAQPLIDMRRITSDDVMSAQVIAIGLSAAIGLVVFLLSPVLGAIYSNITGLQAGLQSLLWLAPLSALGGVEFSMLQRQMRFSRIAKLQTAAVLMAGGIAIALAYFVDTVIGLLCIQGLSGPIFALLSMAARSGRLKGRPSISAARRVFKVGRHLLLEANLAVFVTQGLVLLLGLVLPATQTSLFVAISQFVYLITSQLGRIANIVLLPMVRRSAHDKGRVQTTVLNTSYFSNGLVIAPLIAMYGAPIFILDLLNIQTDDYVVSVFLLLVARQIFDATGNTVFSTFRAVGRPDAGWKWSLFYSLLWFLVSGAAWVLELDLLGVSIVLLVVASLRLGAVYWLCTVVKIRFGLYVRFLMPVYACAVAAVVVSEPLRRMMADLPGPPQLGELAGSTSLMLAYLSGILGIYFFSRRRSLTK